MIRIKVLVEGQTEETFVRDVIAPYYNRLGIYFTPILAQTSPGHKGGVSSYGKVKNQVTRLCRQDKSAFVTTFIDYYALPQDFPGMRAQNFPTQSSAMDKVEFLEGKFQENINEPNFIPFLMLHEYEALLFCCPDKFRDWFDDVEAAIKQLTLVAEGFDTPEYINNSPQTAPSKRISTILPQYKKTLHGPIIASDIGLDSMRNQCKHFDSWLRKVESLASTT